MKYCLSSRQSKAYLEKADEIFVKAQDYRQISDLFIDYPDKTIILELKNEDFEDDKIIKTIEQYAEISSNFCCCIYKLSYANWFKDKNIKFYYGYPVNSYYDVWGLIDLGVEYIKIFAPLTFDIDNLKTFKTKFRMIPNVAYDAYIPRNNGICGQWVRPEDTKWYEEGIYVFEFEDADLEKERTLYRIYAENQEWKGNLNLLITNLNINADNRGFPDELGEIRSNCRQKCAQTLHSCHYCETAFLFEKSLRNYKYNEQNKTLNASQENN